MLSDRDQIANVLARYCFRIDDGDVDGWGGLFTADARLCIGDLELRGRDSIVATMVGWGAFGTGRHVNLNCAIDVADDGTATATTDFLYAWKDPSGQYSLQTTPGPHFGRYHDKLELDGGEWRLAERLITVFADDLLDASAEPGTQDPVAPAD